MVVIIGLGWLGYTFKDRLAKSAVEKAVCAATGLKLDMQGFKVGLWKTDIEIKGLRLFNPPQFKEHLMFDVPYVFVDYDFAALIKKGIHIQNMKIDLRELDVIRDKNGALNISALKPVSNQKQDSAAKKSSQEPPPVRIDYLDLKIGRVIYRDYSKDPANPSIQEFNLNFQGTYTNIKDLRSLVNIIIGRALVDTAINQLIDFDVSGLKRTFTNILTVPRHSSEEK